MTTELRFDLGSPPACPLCGAGVAGYEFHRGLIYQVPFGGLFGGPATYIVWPGESPPPQAGDAELVASMPGTDRTTLRPCGHQLGEVHFFARNGAVSRIEGKEYVGH